MCFVFLWPLSTKCTSNFSNKFQFMLGPSMAGWRNLFSSKPTKDSTNTFLWHLVYQCILVNHYMISLQHSFGCSSILDSYSSHIYVETFIKWYKKPYQGVGRGPGVGDYLIVFSLFLFVLLSFGLSCPISFLSE